MNETAREIKALAQQGYGVSILPILDGSESISVAVIGHGMALSKIVSVLELELSRGDIIAAALADLRKEITKIYIVRIP